MRTPDQVANHPKARLHREVVTRLRAYGSIQGAEEAWPVLGQHRRLWKRIVTFGLNRIEQQRRLNKVAFPDCNWMEVDAALGAGNNLKAIHDLACGKASLVTDFAGNYQTGVYGLKVIIQKPAMPRPIPSK